MISPFLFRPHSTTHKSILIPISIITNMERTSEVHWQPNTTVRKTRPYLYKSASCLLELLPSPNFVSDKASALSSKLRLNSLVVCIFFLFPLCVMIGFPIVLGRILRLLEENIMKIHLRFYCFIY